MSRTTNRSIRAFRGYMILFLLATAAISAYYWFAYRSAVPSYLSGTPADPSMWLTETALRDTLTLSMLRDILYFVGYFWEWGILLWLLTSGTSRWLSHGLKSKIRSPILRFPIFIAGFTVVLFALGAPLRLLSYAISKNYGISTMTLPAWFRDQLVHFVVDAALLLVVGSVVFFLARKGGTWWFRLWLLSIPFVIFMMYVRPIAIDPLFYKFEPLSDVHLEQSIVAMTERAGVPTDRVYEANFSEKTNAINAYVDGFGPSLRIVIWDTALQKLEEAEILVLTAHEIAHYVMHHLQWSALGAVGSLFVMLWFGNRLYRFALKRWRAFLFVRHPADWAGLPLMLLVVSVLTFASTPLSSAISRQAEYEADRFAYAVTENPEAAVSLYQKLSASSKGAVHPPALTYWFRYTHPSIGDRIGEALRYEAARK
ncbi:M48 family metallopeptidase [Paenibacillus sp. TRM 82003]|nr:M48 family metallopeptidase [Paenibacillus sp. TRM 82003]